LLALPEGRPEEHNVCSSKVFATTPISLQPQPDAQIMSAPLLSQVALIEAPATRRFTYDISMNINQP